MKVYICLNCKTIHVNHDNDFTCANCGGKTHDKTSPLNMKRADNFDKETMPLPCPFCGDPDIEVEREGSNRASRIVNCTNCGCGLESNEIKSWNEWNNRVTL